MKSSFCPKCGSKLQLKKLTCEDKKRLICTNPKCSFIFYQNPTPTTFAIIEKNNQVLLIKRKINPFKGDWDLPGGFVEENETLEQALGREVKEETNLEIISYNYYGSALTAYTNKSDNHLGQNLGSCFICLTQGELKPGDDAIELKFFPWKKLPDNLADFTDVKDMLFKRQNEMLNFPVIKTNPLFQTKIGIGVIIKNQKNQILLIQRKGAHGAGEWAFPGGKLDFGEKIIDCAKREVFEEIGLKLDKIKIITVNEDFEYIKSHNTHWITIACQTQISGQIPTIKEPEKVSQIKWFGLDKLPTPIFPPTNRSLNCLIQNRISIENNS